MLRKVTILVLLMVGLFVSPTAARAAMYYVDAAAGNDSNNGTSEATPWKTLSKISSKTYAAGDVVLLKRGSVFVSPSVLVLKGWGFEGNRITLNAYGSGSVPVIDNTDTTQYDAGVDVQGSYYEVSNIRIANEAVAGNGTETGIRLKGNFINLHDVEVSNVGHAIAVTGSDITIYNANLHDGRMIVNDSAPDNDYGAVGVLISGGAAQRISVYNSTFTNFRQPSIDYGTDGSALEIFDSVNMVNFYNNTVTNADTLTEIGGSSGWSVIQNINYHHTILVNSHSAFTFHNGSGSYPVNINQVKMEHNTLVKDTTTSEGFLMSFSSPPAANQFYFRNNIVSYRNTDPGKSFIWNIGNLVHTNNLYQLTNVSNMFTLNASEITGDPKFVHATGRDYRLQLGSAAIDIGANLGYTTDFAGSPIPTDTNGADKPDAGGYEFVGTIPNPTPTPSVSPDSCNVADINRDGVVDITDYSLLVIDFFKSPPANPRSDINTDGIVDLTDYSLLVKNFLQTGTCL